MIVHFQDSRILLETDAGLVNIGLVIQDRLDLMNMQTLVAEFGRDGCLKIGDGNQTLFYDFRTAQWSKELPAHLNGAPI